MNIFSPINFLKILKTQTETYKSVKNDTNLDKSNVVEGYSPVEQVKGLVVIILIIILLYIVTFIWSITALIIFWNKLHVSIRVIVILLLLFINYIPFSPVIALIMIYVYIHVTKNNLNV